MSAPLFQLILISSAPENSYSFSPVFIPPASPHRTGQKCTSALARQGQCLTHERYFLFLGNLDSAGQSQSCWKPSSSAVREVSQPVSCSLDFPDNSLGSVLNASENTHVAIPRVSLKCLSPGRWCRRYLSSLLASGEEGMALNSRAKACAKLCSVGQCPGHSVC